MSNYCLATVFHIVLVFPWDWFSSLMSSCSVGSPPCTSWLVAFLVPCWCISVLMLMYTTTVGIGSFFFRSATHCVLESMTSLDSLLFPSCGFASSPSIDFAFDSASYSVVTYLLSPISPSCLLRERSCNVILVFLYQSFRNVFFTLILTVPTESIQKYPKTISRSPGERLQIFEALFH